MTGNEMNQRRPPGGAIQVGYCRPPLATRFRPGNPETRGAAEGLAQLAHGRGGGGPRIGGDQGNDRLRRITKLEAVVKQLANRAAKGEERATKHFLDLLDALERRPQPAEAEPLGEYDAAVIADLVRRIRASSP